MSLPWTYLLLAIVSEGVKSQLAHVVPAVNRNLGLRRVTEVTGTVDHDILPSGTRHLMAGDGIKVTKL